MIKADITAYRGSQDYEVTASLGESVISIKWDSGAKYTVISARVFNSRLTDEDLEKIKTYCEEHSSHREKFVSATGHTFDGYLVKVHNATIGNTDFNDLYYYLVVENERDIALMGFDFIDNCKGSFEPHGDIIITEFDEERYGSHIPGAVDNDEVISLIDSLST